MSHAHHDFGHPGAGRRVEKRIQQHDGRLGTLETEALLPDVAGVEEPLEDLGRVEAVEDVTLLLDVERGRLTLDMLLDPTLLLGILDVHVLDGQGAAVGVAQDVEDLVEGGDLAPCQAVGDELARQVPDGEAVRQRVEFGVDVRGLGVERVEVGDEVPAHPVHVDQRLHVHLLDQVLLAALADAGVRVDLPPHRLVRHGHRLEEVLVEAIRPGEEGRDAAEEQARLRALDDAVVVGRGEGDDLAQPELRDDVRVRRLETGRIAERAHADDGALPRHQPRHRLHRPERAGVGQRHGRAGEVVGADLAGVDLADQLLVGEDERAEVERVGVLDARDEQRARPVALLLVHRQAQPNVLVMDDPRLARPVDVGHEGRVEGRYVVQGAHHGVADDVGEADLGAGRPGELIVEDEAVDLEQARRHGADAGRGGDGQAGFHVGDDPGGRTAQRGGLLAPRRHDRRRSRGGDRRGSGGPRRSRRRRRGGRDRLGRGRDRTGLVVGEKLAPALRDRVGVGQEAVVHVVDQPCVRPERAS